MTARGSNGRRMVRVYAPNTEYAGITAGIQFANGVAELDPEAHLEAMNHFRRAQLWN